MQTAHAKRSNPYLPALAGALVILAGAAAVFGLMRRSATPSIASSPERDMQALSEAIANNDLDTALTYIDLDALYDDVLVSSVAATMNLEMDDPKVKIAVAGINPQLRQKLFDSFKVSLSDLSLSRSEPGTLLSSLSMIEGKRIVRVTADSAYVELPDDRQLTLVRASDTGTWRIAGFRGYEKDIDAYKETAQARITDMMIPKDQQRKPDGASEAPNAEPTNP